MAEQTQTRTFADVLSEKLTEQNIQLDASAVPQDVTAADAWLSGDGTHLAGTPLAAYVDAWGWETLKPMLEYAIGTADAVASGAAGDYQATDADTQASWVYNLLVVSELTELGLDPYSAPDAVHVVELVRGGVTNADTWPELSRLLDGMEEDKANEVKQKLLTGLDYAGEPPPSQW
jgi:hypothetical protein